MDEFRQSDELVSEIEAYEAELEYKAQQMAQSQANKAS